MVKNYISQNPYRDCDDGFIEIRGLFHDVYTKLPITSAQRILTATRGVDIPELEFFKMVFTRVIRQPIVSFTYGLMFNPNNLLTDTYPNIDLRKIPVLYSEKLNFNVIDIEKGKHFFNHIYEALEVYIETWGQTNSPLVKADLYYFKKLQNIVTELWDTESWVGDYHLTIIKIITELITLVPYTSTMTDDTYGYLESPVLQAEVDFHQGAKKEYEQLYFLKRLGALVNEVI